MDLELVADVLVDEGRFFCQRRVPVADSATVHIAPSPPQRREPTGSEVALTPGLGRIFVLGCIYAAVYDGRNTYEWEKCEAAPLGASVAAGRSNLFIQILAVPVVAAIRTVSEGREVVVLGVRVVHLGCRPEDCIVMGGEKFSYPTFCEGLEAIIFHADCKVACELPFHFLKDIIFHGP